MLQSAKIQLMWGECNTGSGSYEAHEKILICKQSYVLSSNGIRKYIFPAPRFSPVEFIFSFLLSTMQQYQDFKIQPFSTLLPPIVWKCHSPRAWKHFWVALIVPKNFASLNNNQITRATFLVCHKWWKESTARIFCICAVYDNC